MTIYINHSQDSEYHNNLYLPIKHSSLVFSHSVIFPYDKDTSGIDAKELFSLKQCDLVLAEVSNPSFNQAIELGWADMSGIPIVCIYKEHAVIPETLHRLSKRFLMYTSAENMIEDIAGVVKQYE